MNNTAFFQEQLATSAAQFAWAAGLLPTGRHHVMPLPIFGEWSVARIVYHVMWQEANIVLPVLQTWTKANTFIQVDFNVEDRQWWQEMHSVPVPSMIERFRSNRSGLVQAVAELPASAWDSVKDNPFGMVSPRWIITRAIQHTFEHADTLMKMHLYWDIALAELAQARRLLGEERGSYKEDSDLNR